MNTENKSKNNPLVVILIFLVTAVVVFSTVFLILYLNSDFKEIKANKTEYYVNVGETVKLDLTFTNILETDYEITSQDTNIAAYNSADDVVEGLSGGKVAIIISSSTIENFVPIALTITVCDGLTQETAIMIDSKEDLIAVGSSEEMLTKCYRVIADIDLGNEEWVPLGIIGDEVFEYTGKFNGGAYTISNLTITTPYSNSGLFAHLGADAILYSLNLNNINVETETKQGVSYLLLGSVAGRNDGTVQNVYVTGSSLINTAANSSEVYVGGIVGFNTGIVSQTSFENSFIISGDYAGGIVGANISVCQNLATIKQSGVNAEVWGKSHIGGVVGIAKGSIISDCFSSNESKVYATSATTYVGGIAGTVQYASVNSNIVNSLVINCYAVADLGSVGYKGSLISWNYNYNSLALQYNKVLGCYFTDQTGASEAVYRTQNGTAQISTTKLTATDLSNEYNFVSYLSDSGNNVMWDFTNIWTMDSNNYPTLVRFGEVSKFDVNDIKENGEIFSAVDLMNIVNNMSGAYVIKADIDLSVVGNWIAIGSETNAFEGSLIADTNPTTLEFYKITNFKAQDANDNVGLFAKIGANGKLANIVLDGAQVSGSTKNIGLIAVENGGTIENSVVKNAKIDLNNTKGNIGFVTANNNGVVASSYVQNSEITLGDTGEYVVGSIAGLNNNVVHRCYTLNTTKISANTSNQNVVAGGLVGVNEEKGQIRFSFSEGEFTAFALGGLVGVNKNYIYECYAENTLTGKYVGGLAYNVTFGKTNSYGVIANCYTLSELNGVDKNSVKSGFAYIIDYCAEGENAGKYGLIYHCFSAVNFNTTGKNYFETHSRYIRTDTIYVFFGIKVDRCAGFVVDSIYDIQGRDAEEISSYITVDIFDPISQEGPLGYDTAGCFNESNFLNEGFSINTWEFSSDYYPQLKNVVKAN